VPTARHDVILLDLDGTLTDSAPGILNCLRYALDRLGIAHPDDVTMRAFLGPPLATTFSRHFGMTDTEVERAIAMYRERYHDVGLFENEVYAGIPELLDGLDGTGAVLAVATSKPTYSATRILEHFGLAGHFAFIGGAELDGSRNVKADVIAHVLDELAALGRLPSVPRRVMVGDREHDVLGARAHAIDCVGVLWGYGDEPELIAAGAVEVVGSPAELLARLTR
jgi:phosphoglycolate phosphatase